MSTNIESHKKPVITPEMNQKYITNHASVCPFCESPDIGGSSFDAEAGLVWQDITCAECGESWQDIYQLVRIDNEFSERRRPMARYELRMNAEHWLMVEAESAEDARQIGEDTPVEDWDSVSWSEIDVTPMDGEGE